MREKLIVGALGLVAVAVIFGGPITKWVARIGESPAEARARRYKEARHELADPGTATREQLSVERELTAHEKDLVEAGYWKGPQSDEAASKASSRSTRREPSRDALGEEIHDGSDPRLSIRERREQLRKGDKTNEPAR